MSCWGELCGSLQPDRPTVWVAFQASSGSYIKRIVSPFKSLSWNCLQPTTWVVCKLWSIMFPFLTMSFMLLFCISFFFSPGMVLKRPLPSWGFSQDTQWRKPSKALPTMLWWSFTVMQPMEAFLSSTSMVGTAHCDARVWGCACFLTCRMRPWWFNWTLLTYSTKVYQLPSLPYHRAA